MTHSKLARSAHCIVQAGTCVAALSIAVFMNGNATADSLPERVSFASADGRTTLVGYVFEPEAPHARAPRRW